MISKAARVTLRWRDRKQSPGGVGAPRGVEDGRMSTTLTSAHPVAACRIERGARLVTAGAVTPIYGIGFLVASESEPGRDYWVMRVNDVLTCDCEDCRNRGANCKHAWATVLFAACERLDAEQADPTCAPIPYALN